MHMSSLLSNNNNIQPNKSAASDSSTTDVSDIQLIETLSSLAASSSTGRTLMVQVIMGL